MAEAAAGPDAVLSPEHFRNPELSAERARELAAEHWRVDAVRTTDVGSLQDQNFRLRGADGAEFVLKIANAAIPVAELEMEHAALRWLAPRLDGVAVPLPLATADGAEIVRVDGRLVRLMTWVPGAPMEALGHLDDGAIATLGRLAAASGLALVGFDHPGAHRHSQWDTRIASAVVAAIAPGLGADEGERLEQALAPLRDLDPALTARLPMQTIHSDVTDRNVVGTTDGGGRFTATGLIDFGDLVHTWRICDPASAAISAIAGAPADPLGAALAVLAGYRAVRELEEAELDAYWPAVLARAAVCAASSTEQLRQSPQNVYAAESVALDWAALDAALSVPAALAGAAVRAAAGRSPIAGAVESKGERREADLRARLRAADPVPLLPGLDPARLRPVDLGVASPDLVGGGWETAAGLAAALDVGPEAVALGRWGEVRMPHAGAPAESQPATLHLGADLFLEAGTEVAAPLAGEVVAVGEGEVSIALSLDEGAGGARGAGPFLRIAGIASELARGDRVERADVVGHVRGREPDSAASGRPAAPLPPHVHLQLALAPGLPGLGDPRRREAWLALCPDPSPLLGSAAAAPPPPDPDAGRLRRRAVLAGAQGLYYRDSLEVVRGWRATLFDSDARPYLDVVNNVAAVGHSHPGVAAAAHEQMQLLNTNSRFLYDALTEYAERIAALLPPQLDRVFVVNSGSEALDLAVQLGRVYTGRRDLAAISGAYHGWTESVFEACTSPQDNPAWRESKPPWVHVVDQPDPYRGRHGGGAAAYVESVAAACASAEEGGGIAAFLAEALLGNQGAVVPPPGYLAAAFESVRAAGGVCIADEVQVGYARTGSDFWAFEHEGVVPDIVATAKATGNGHPIGVVACRAEIADALGRRASFFSSTGGGPVSCRVGIAVLDAIRDEGLQERAAEVGAHLKGGLERLAESHPAIGAVNGRGLYLGVDIVADRATREPAPAEAAAICERLRGLGVIVQPTGDAYNVLKVKPPMCIGLDQADYFVAMLDRVLGERERLADLAP